MAIMSLLQASIHIIIRSRKRSLAIKGARSTSKKQKQNCTQWIGFKKPTAEEGNILFVFRFLYINKLEKKKKKYTKFTATNIFEDAKREMDTNI